MGRSEYTSISGSVSPGELITSWGYPAPRAIVRSSSQLSTRSQRVDFITSHVVPSYPTNLIEFPKLTSYRWKKNIFVLVSRVFRTDPLLGPSNPGPANHICFQRRGRGMCHSEYPGCFHKQVPRYPQCSHQYTWLLWKFIPQNNGRSSNETHIL